MFPYYRKRTDNIYFFVLFLPELRSIPDSCSQLLVDILLVEAQLVKHANQEPVFLFCVVLALVSAVVDS